MYPIAPESVPFALAESRDIAYRAGIMSEAPPSAPGPFDALNPAQRAAVEHGMEALAAGGRPGPLLVVAGAGSGKTRTLTARVARLALAGADPRRILLLTFTRRAAQEMSRRARVLVADALGGDAATAVDLPWSGTFHAVGQRVLRLHAHEVGLSPDFTVLDRSDAEDLLDIVRDELGLAARTRKRFPRKGACLAIYSHAVNARTALDEVLETRFPQYADFPGELNELFRAYVEAKQARDLLDYDDLLLYWAGALAEPAVAAGMRARFDHVLVDEYQDTNAVQEDILLGLVPDGAGLTVVGDDAQAIYGFRAATVENILRFPAHFEPPAEVVTLERSYRATQPLLAAANAVIGLSPRGYAKELFARRGGEHPRLVTVADENAQVDHVADAVLARREEGVDLQRQAVLMRAGWHSGALEIELGRRHVPFVKYGGLKFLEAAHVKDVIALLRWAENPRDTVAAFRVLQVLPGIGPGYARRAMAAIDGDGRPGEALRAFRGPAAARGEIEALAEVMTRLADPDTPWPAQPGLARQWYARHIDRRHDNPQVRMRDLEQLERIAAGYPGRGRFLAEVALDPPETAGDEAGPPLIDDDYLILSTIHSAKGQEYDTVYVLNVVDGCIPSDMATGDAEEIEEERRLLYVAMTRARERLELIVPHRFHRTNQRRHGDGHVTAAPSRFIPDAIADRFARQTGGTAVAAEPGAEGSPARIDLKSGMRDMWR